MFNKTKKLALNRKFLRFFLIPAILFSTPFLNNFQGAKAGLEFQWDQDSGYRRLKWFQKENKEDLEIQFKAPRPVDRKNDLLKIKLSNPKPFKETE